MNKRASNRRNDDGSQLASSTRQPVRKTPVSQKGNQSSTIKHIRPSPDAAQAGRVRPHHFPLYSHPMFRAAIYNSDAVRSAIATQSQQVDHAALDDAVEDMVNELLRQQAAFGAADTIDAGGNGQPAVSEEQLLALLARVSRAPANSHSAAAPPPTQGSAASLNPPASPYTETFASASGLQHRPLPHSTRHAATLSQKQQQQGVRVSSSSPLPEHNDDAHIGPDSTNDVQVVSVNALQKAAQGHTRRTSQRGTAAPHLPSSAEPQVKCVYASSIPHGHALTSEEAVGAAKSPPTLSTSAPAHSTEASFLGSTGTSALRPARTQARAKGQANPYSLLPMAYVDAEGNDNVNTQMDEGKVSSATGAPSPSRGITFEEMDLRPGKNSGPVAQQAVDATHLHGVSDSVFAAMDVLMDGNSCCMRRRQRGPAGRGRGGGSVFSIRGGPSPGMASAPMRSGFYGTPPPNLTSSSTYSGIPANAPSSSSSCALVSSQFAPRTAMEAKARRILEAQRRRQQQQQGPPPASSPPYATAPQQPSCGSTTLMSHSALSPSLKRGGLTEEGEKSRTVTLPPLATVRGMASSSLYAQAVNSAQHYTGLYQ